MKFGLDAHTVLELLDAMSGLSNQAFCFSIFVIPTCFRCGSVLIGMTRLRVDSGGCGHIGPNQKLAHDAICACDFSYFA